MRIGIQTWGTDGDVMPFFALASGLKGAGHEVTLAYTSVENKDYSALADSLGIRLVRAGVYDRIPEELNAEIAAFFRIPNTLKQTLVMMRDFFNPMVPEMYGASSTLCEENDLVLGHLLVHPLRAASDKSGRPYVCVFLTHMLPTRHFPPLGTPDLGGALNPLLWKVAGFVMNRTLLPMDNALRREVGLPPVRDLMASLQNPRNFNLIAVSPSLVGRPSDWDDRQRICGFLNMPHSGTSWEMPPGLDAFLKDGPPPVYMTFGSMLAVDAAAIGDTTRIMVGAARKAGCRAVVQTVWEGVDEFSGYKDICFVRRAPHQLVFPRCSLVVHHGGAGSTQSATMAGCPSVVVPYGLDQPVWARVLNGLGIAPKPVPRLKLSAERLAGAIRIVLDNPEMKQRAGVIASVIKDEDGVKNAVGMVGEHFAR